MAAGPVTLEIDDREGDGRGLTPILVVSGVSAEELRRLWDALPPAWRFTPPDSSPYSPRAVGNGIQFFSAVVIQGEVPDAG